MICFPIRSCTLAAALLLLSSCMQPARFIGDGSRQNTKGGALIGTMMGAAVGLVTADNSDERPGTVVKASIIGAGLGALAGTLLIGERRTCVVIWKTALCRSPTPETV